MNRGGIVYETFPIYVPQYYREEHSSHSFIILFHRNNGDLLDCLKLRLGKMYVFYSSDFENYTRLVFLFRLTDN